MTILLPRSPKSETRTAPVQITPGASRFDIRTFEYSACDLIHETVGELIDPMKSPEIAGWLTGELRAPN